MCVPDGIIAESEIKFSGKTEYQLVWRVAGVSRVDVKRKRWQRQWHGAPHFTWNAISFLLLYAVAIIIVLHGDKRDVFSSLLSPSQAAVVVCDSRAIFRSFAAYANLNIFVIPCFATRATLWKSVKMTRHRFRWMCQLCAENVLHSNNVAYERLNAINFRFNSYWTNK